MNTSRRPRLLSLSCSALLLFVLLLATVGPLPAAEPPAGKVVAVAGQVTAAGPDGTIRTIAKDDSIFAGDIINTGPNSRVRIVFSDQGVIFLRPSTRFVIKTYTHSGDQEKDESDFSLVRGGFRSVTGAIGHTNPKNYKVDTPVATIGIRGTDHEGRFCANDCADLVDVGVDPPPDGLYTGTNTGETMVGDQSFGAGQYGYTSLDGRTTRLPEPPPILIRDPLLPAALTDRGSESQDQGAAGSGEGSGDGAGGASGGSAGTATGGSAGANDTPDEEGFEIPAKPPTTRTIECR